MDERLCRVLANPLKLSINSFHLFIFSFFCIKVIEIKMASFTQELSQLELVIDHKANITDILFAEMVISLIASTVFLSNFRVGVTLERIVISITFRSWLCLIFAKISNCLNLLL